MWKNAVNVNEFLYPISSSILRSFTKEMKKSNQRTQNLAQYEQDWSGEMSPELLFKKF